VKKLKKYLIHLNESWEITHHELYEIETSILSKSNPTIPDEFLDYLVEDLFQASNTSKGLTLDIGWYPESDSNGEYFLKLIKDSDWTNPMVVLHGRNIEKIIEKIDGHI